MSDQVPVPPSISWTCWEERGRNGVSSVLASSTSCKATCSTVRIRSGSDSRSFHGACSEKYLFASATVRIASLIANLNREADRGPPTVPNACRDRRRDRPDVLRRERDRAVDQVAPGRDQLVVVAADELAPGEVGVLGFR